MSPPLPRIGAHVSVAGGLLRVLPRARRIGAEAVQIFCSSPRRWQPPEYPDASVAEFAATLKAVAIPLFVHSIYLINLASPDDALWERSIHALVGALQFAARAGAAGVVTHIGSSRGSDTAQARRRVGAALDRVLEQSERGDGTPRRPRLLLEGSAGGTHSLGGTVEELGALVCACPAELGAGMCLDTAHLFAAGYPIHHHVGLERFLDQVDALLGLDRLHLVHLNDCATDLGGKRDRHANLWEGGLGREGVAAWVGNPRLRQVPFVLETPGFDGQGPDRRNVMRAKRLRP